MHKFSTWRFILATVVFLIIALIFHMLDGVVSLKYYMDPLYTGIWSKFMMPEPGPPPASFMYMSVAFNLVCSIIFVGVYVLLKNVMPGKSLAGKGVFYAIITFLLAGLTGMLAMLLLLNLPLGLILMWTAEDLLSRLIGGLTTAYIVK